MEILKLTFEQSFENSAKVEKHLQEFRILLETLRKMEIPHEVVEKINNQVSTVNSLTEGEKRPVSKIHTAHHLTLEILRKEMSLTPEKYFTYLWLPMGMAAFGLPLGTLIFAITGNVAFISLGLPIGVAVGLFVGMALDNKAKKEKRVLVLE